MMPGKLNLFACLIPIALALFVSLCLGTPIASADTTAETGVTVELTDAGTLDVQWGGDDPTFTVGGPNSGDGNVVSGNLGSGILAGNDNGGSCTVQGNLIGVAPDGVSPMGNGSHGVETTSFGISVGGTTGVTPGACTGSSQSRSIDT